MRQVPVAEATAIGAYLIGVATNSTYPTAQMETLAEETGSYADTDGDGVADDVLVESPDVVVLHEGPEGDRRQRGHPAIGARLRTMQVRLTICGHVHWAEPLATLGPTGQVLNVAGRAWSMKYIGPS